LLTNTFSLADAVILSPISDSSPDLAHFAQAKELLIRIVHKFVQNLLSKMIPHTFHQMEHIILEELFLALIKSTIDTILAKCKHNYNWLVKGTNDMDMTLHPPSVANLKIISINSEEFINDEVLEDVNYKETNED
jgi:hypothetical protein